MVIHLIVPPQIWKSEGLHYTVHRYNAPVFIAYYFMKKNSSKIGALI